MKEPFAIISSTIAPPISNHYGGVAFGYDPYRRLEQTRQSVQALLAIGIQEIYVADNSGANWRGEMEEKLKPAQVHVFCQHQYRNKGISELYLLLAALPHLPTGRPIVKLSGRYVLTHRLDAELGERDFVVREWHGLSLLQCCISTIAYAVRDAAVYEHFLRETLREVFGFSARVVGPRSLLRILRNSMFPFRDEFPYDDPMGSIEHASWRALRKNRCRVEAVESLGVEGTGGQTGEQFTQ